MTVESGSRGAAVPQRFDERLERIRERLQRLRDSGRFLDEFGIEEHRFALDRPLSEAQVVAFERRCGIALPEDFRAFVTRLGGGGAGPYYGILPPGRWEDVASCNGRRGASSSLLGRPCPLVPGVRYGLDWGKGIRPVSKRDPYHGLLAVSDCGCAYFCTLVLSGPARGRICYIHHEVDLRPGFPRSDPPYFPEDDGFLSWYERWLDELEAGYDMGYFGFGAKGSDAEVCAILAEDESDWRREEAAFALVRRPALTDAVVDGLLNALRRDGSARVRAQAAKALWKSGESRTLAGLRCALADPERIVRQSAIWSLWKLKNAGHAIADEIFVGQLDSPDSRVVRTAIWALMGRGGGPYRPELAALLRHRDAEIRGSAAYALGMSGCGEAIVPLRKALADRDPEVRREVTRALESLGWDPKRRAPGLFRSLVRLLRRRKG